MRASHPHETQQQTADAVGCSRSMVATIVNKSSESEKSLTVPKWVTSKDMQAAFRKLPADERARRPKSADADATRTALPV